MESEHVSKIAMALLLPLLGARSSFTLLMSSITLLITSQALLIDKCKMNPVQTGRRLNALKLPSTGRATGQVT